MDRISELEYFNKDYKKAADQAREEVTKIKLARTFSKGLSRGITGDLSSKGGIAEMLSHQNTDVANYNTGPNPRSSQGSNINILEVPSEKYGNQSSRSKGIYEEAVEEDGVVSQNNISGSVHSSRIGESRGS